MGRGCERRRESKKKKEQRERKCIFFFVTLLCFVLVFFFSPLVFSLLPSLHLHPRTRLREATDTTSIKIPIAQQGTAKRTLKTSCRCAATATTAPRATKSDGNGMEDADSKTIGTRAWFGPPSLIPCSVLARHVSNSSSRETCNFCSRSCKVEKCYRHPTTALLSSPPLLPRGPPLPVPLRPLPSSRPIRCGVFFFFVSFPRPGNHTEGASAPDGCPNAEFNFLPCLTRR